MTGSKSLCRDVCARKNGFLRDFYKRARKNNFERSWWVNAELWFVFWCIVEFFENKSSKNCVFLSHIYVFFSTWTNNKMAIKKKQLELSSLAVQNTKIQGHTYLNVTNLFMRVFLNCLYLNSYFTAWIYDYDFYFV